MNRSRSSRLVRIGTFLLLFGAYLLFLKAPATDSKQQAFRVGVAALGGVLLVVGGVLKARERPDNTP